MAAAQRVATPFVSGHYRLSSRFQFTVFNRLASYVEASSLLPAPAKAAVDGVAKPTE